MNRKWAIKNKIDCDWDSSKILFKKLPKIKETKVEKVELKKCILKNFPKIKYNRKV